MNPIYSVIIPVYNEELVLDESYRRLKAVMDDLNESYELIFVNDGSRDCSLKILNGLCSRDDRVRVINFSRNFGHQPAITAGMDYARGAAIVIIDADLQDPPEVIAQMAELWKQGYQVVYGTRASRQGESLFKKISAKIFYRTLKNMTSIDIPVDSGDFRLIDRKVCEAVKSLGEKNRYMRGMVSWVGFRQTSVPYVREARFAGETKYPLKKMIKFAMDGITSFSYKPLKLATSLGFTISLVSFLYILVVIYQRLFTDTTITGWSSLIGVILFTQGIVLMMLGLMGEYIGRIYEETKNRPVYIVADIIERIDECEKNDEKKDG